MCHLYREFEREGREPARDHAMPPSRLRPRRIAAAAAGLAAVTAVAAVFWFDITPFEVSGERSRVTAVAVPTALAREGATADAPLARTADASLSTPLSVEQAGVGYDDGVPSTQAGRGSAGAECGHSL